jgi:hypothetical protein
MTAQMLKLIWEPFKVFLAASIIKSARVMCTSFTEEYNKQNLWILWVYSQKNWADPKFFAPNENKA